MAVAVTFLFLAMLIPTGVQAGYSMAISGGGDFTATPFQAQIFNGTDIYVRIYLSDTSPSSLSIEMGADGTLAPYVSFPEYTGTPTFTLFPGQNKKVLYRIDMPASEPGKYTGTIQAIGTPPASVTDNATGAIGKPVVGLNIVVDVPSEIQIFNLITHTLGFPDAQSAIWGNGWSSNVSVVNAGNATFNGTLNLTLAGGTVNEYRVFDITNLSVAGSVTFGKIWQNNLPLGTDYVITALVYSDASEKMDEEAMGFTIPSPANIISVERDPLQAFPADTVAVYAVVASSDSTVTLHWRVNNGTEITAQMVYAAGEFAGSIPPQAMSSTITYWVTSVNGAYSDRDPVTGAYSYYIFSPDMPDLAITEDAISYFPIDPRNQTMNETEGTNIYILVRNLGRGSATSFVVRVYDYETPIWNTTVMLASPNIDSTPVRFYWLPTEGNHILRFEVDPDNAIAELDENNNHFTMPEVTIGPAPPAPPIVGPESDWAEIIPYLVIPLILAIIIIVIILLRRKKKK